MLFTGEFESRIIEAVNEVQLRLLSHGNDYVSYGDGLVKVG